MCQLRHLSGIRGVGAVMGKFRWGLFHVPGRWRASAALVACLFLLSFIMFPRAVHAGTTHLTWVALPRPPSRRRSPPPYPATRSSSIRIAPSLPPPPSPSPPRRTSPSTPPGTPSSSMVATPGSILHLQAAEQPWPDRHPDRPHLPTRLSHPGGRDLQRPGHAHDHHSARSSTTARRQRRRHRECRGHPQDHEHHLLRQHGHGTTRATGGAIDNTAFGTVTLVSRTISGNRVTSTAAQSASGAGASSTSPAWRAV